jgi:hypothetical protein
MKSTYIIGVYDRDDHLVETIKQLKEDNIPIKDVHTPFPVHDVLKLLGKESRLPNFSFVAGVFTIIATLGFLYWTAVISYPMSFGGKPVFPLPSFVVLIYLITILMTFISTVIVFQALTGLYPGKTEAIIHQQSTDDKFVIAVEMNDNKTQVEKLMKEKGAVEIFEKEM